MMNAPALDELIANLQHEADVASERLRLATELRAALANGDGVLGVTPTRPAAELPAPPAAAKPATTKPARAARPARTAQSRKRTSRPPDVGYPAIAAVINEAVAAGKPMINVLAERFGVPTTTAKNWITKCRKLGLVGDGKSKPARIPPPSPGRAAAPSSSERAVPGGKVLRCGDCKDEFATVPELIEHTLKAHGRQPRATERTPVTPG